MIIARRAFSFIIQSFIAIIVLILIGVFPILFQNLSFHFHDYLQAIHQETIRIFTLDKLTIDQRNNPLFPSIFDRYLDSMRILGMGILLASFLALLTSYISLLVFPKKMNIIKKLLELLESVPDLMFILLLQMVVIIIFKTTGIKLAQVVTVREKTILLPIISIAVPISFYMTKVLIHYIEVELEKNYIELAKSKGFSYFYILNVHVLRNIVEGIFGTSKTIFWSMLSTLLVVDYLFNMNGLLRVMLQTTDAFIAGCILIFIPFFLLYRIYDWVVFSSRKDTH
jgi:peptide/nickel transport system permease protein